MTTLQKIIEHFGMTVAQYGFRPDETPTEFGIRDRLLHRPEYELFITTLNVAKWLEAPRYYAYTAGDLEPLVLNDQGQLVITYNHAREMARTFIVNRRVNLNADVITIAALVVTGRMTRENITQLCEVTV